jgi:hypothetical protein
MVIFNNDNIHDYFSPATESDSATVVGKRLFDFVDRRSKTLIITIGDSWTWGADLTQHNETTLHLDRRADDDYRINTVYGNVLASRLNADFLNLGESGAGNWHIVRKLNELKTISNQLTYDDILIVGVFTECGRDFNSHCDLNVDYRSWLLNNINAADRYYGFLEFVNSCIAESVLSIIQQLDSRFRFVFATNFVDPIGYDPLQPWFVPQSWLKIICTEQQLDYQPDQCYMVFPWVIEKFEAVFDMAPELDRLTWLSWISKVTEQANIRAKLCQQDNKNFAQLLHPTAVNHLCWANYLHNIVHEQV